MSQHDVAGMGFYIAVAQPTYPRTTEAFRLTTEAVSGHRTTAGFGLS